MSRWTVLRLLSIAILGLWLASPVLAQRPNPWRVASCEAPMPRAKEKHGELRLGIRFGGPQAVQMIYELRIDGEPAPAPMPRTAGACPSCAGVELVQVNGPGHLQLQFDPAQTAPMPQSCPNHGRVGGDVLFEQRVIPTGSMLLGVNPVPSVPPCCDANHYAPAGLGQPHPLTIHRLPSCSEMSYSWTLHAPAAGVPQTASCCEANGWWLDSAPLPQPRHGIPVVVFPPGWDHGPVMMAESGGVQLDLRSVSAPASHGCPLSSAASPVAHCQATASMACCTNAGKLAGTWYREANGMVIAVTLAGDEMKVCTTLCADGHTGCVTLTADYAITKDGVVHGIVTGADVSMKSLLNVGESKGDGPLEASAEFQKLVDCPFSFRAKMTSAGVMISNFKMAAADLDKDDLAMACGLYKPAVDGKIPSPGMVKVRTISRCVDAPCQPPVAVEVVTRTIPDTVRVMPQPVPPGVVIPTCASARAVAGPVSSGCATAGMPVGPSPSEHCAPRCVPMPATGMGCSTTPVPTNWNPPKPANVPVGDFGMMADVFGQMVCTPAAQPCQVQPAALSGTVSRAVPAPPALGPLSRHIEGTWVREVGPMVYVLKIAGDHLTISATAAAEFAKGQVMTQGMVLTADYQLLRDGTTLVGVVSGVDMILDGDLPPIDDVSMPAEAMQIVQKALADKPLAMSLRVYGDTLMVGNVRLTSEGLPEAGFPLTSVGGRYKCVGEKEIPKPKVTKVRDLPLCQPVAQMPPPPYAIPTGAYPAPPFVGGIMTTEYSTSPYPIGNPPLNPYGPPGPAIGPPPQPMYFPPPPVESPTVKPGKKKPMRSAPAPVGTR